MSKRPSYRLRIALRELRCHLGHGHIFKLIWHSTRTKEDIWQCQLCYRITRVEKATGATGTPLPK